MLLYASSVAARQRNRLGVIPEEERAEAVSETKWVVTNASPS
jgi:hypothetical protein